MYNHVLVVFHSNNVVYLYLNSTSAKIAALEAKLRQMEEEDVGVAGGVATKKPRLSSNTSRPTTQTKRHTGSKLTNSSHRQQAKTSHRTRVAHHSLT